MVSWAEDADPAVVAEQSEQNQQRINTARIDELLMLGIPGLALRMIDKEQPPLAEASLKKWLQWEYIRIRLLQRLEQWDDLIYRVDTQIPVLEVMPVSSVDINWFKTQQVDAYLQSSRPQISLSMLQGLLWNTDDFVETETIATWRRQVVHCYLNQDKVQDAQRAMQRYAQDYGDLPNEDGMQWAILQARLLMQTNRLREAINQLTQLDSAEARALLNLAKLRAKDISAKSLRKQIKKQLKEHAEDPRQLRLDWYLLLQAGIEANSYYQQVRALESLLSMNGLQALEAVFDGFRRQVTADALWQAYENYGRYIANKRQLLVGDDKTWLKKIRQEKKKTYQARGLYTILAFNSQDASIRQLAFEKLVTVLEQHNGDLGLVHRLFMQSSRISDLTLVPITVRYRLVDYALSRADLKTAVRIMEKLEQPPEGEDLYGWNLRRARVMILGGHYDEGQSLLNEVLEQQQSFEAKQIDAFLQVLFDFQNVDEHARALALFGRLHSYTLSPKVHREIIFWRAESLQALGDYEQAAYLFLKSARPLDNTLDPWFHTASFRAAESMEQANLLNDARRQYLKLLRFTFNAARKAIIQQRLQQLQLRQNKRSRTRIDKAAIEETAAR